VGLNEILNNVFKRHVCGEDQKYRVMVPPRLSSDMQVLLCQRTRRNEVKNVNTITDISLFHRAFFNSIMYKTPTHALFHSTLYYSSVLISLKYTKIFNSTPTCFDLKRSSSGSMTVPC